MAKKSIYLLFNKTSKVLIGEADPEIFKTKDSFGENVLVKKVSFDPELEYWLGDYESGGIQKVSDKPLVDQRSLRLEVMNKILREYDLFTQLNIISEQLEALCGDNKTEKFNAMTQRISELRGSYKNQKQAYIDNPKAYNWVGDEDLIKAASKYNEGFSN